MREKVCEKEHKQEEGRERGKKKGVHVSTLIDYWLFTLYTVHAYLFCTIWEFAQSRDSENVQRNLKIVQVLRLRGTYPYLYLWCVCPELAVVLGIAILWEDFNCALSGWGHEGGREGEREILTVQLKDFLVHVLIPQGIHVSPILPFLCAWWSKLRRTM